MLASGSLGARLAVLRDVLADPNRPLKLGPYGGEDFVDLLLRLVPDSGGPVRQAMTMCLMSYQDPRTARFLVDAFRKSRDAALVLRLGQRLRLEQGVEFFRPFLWENASAQALAAAMICQAEANLSPEEQLRVALLLPGNPTVPPIDATSLSAWVKELTGPLRAQARRRAEEQSALWLWSAWESLDSREQIWLLEWTRKVDAGRARREVERLLQQGQPPPEVVEMACQLGLNLPTALLQHKDPAVRAMAVSVGLADSDLEPFLQGSVVEAVAAVRRCHPETLLHLLADPRWQVRAQAVRQLAALDERPLESVKHRVTSDFPGERVAAVELLRCWGEEAWLEQTLLGPAPPLDQTGGQQGQQQAPA